MASELSKDPDQSNTSPKRHKPAAGPSAPHPMAAALTTWFSGNGGWLSPDVQIVHSPSAGFHLRALRSLTSPIVATCPLKLTLSHLTLDDDQPAVSHVKSPLRQCLGSIPDHVLTYLLLIEQRAKGKESPWYHYIACLPGPESMTTPLWFDQDDMRYLVGTNLAGATNDRKEMLYREWERAMTALRAAEISTFDDIDFNQYLWAATIVSSRAFISTHILPDKETFPILFPVVDILNHSVSAKVEWDFQPNESFSLKFLEAENIATGDELFNNYAPKQNDELLLGYGFCLPDNPIEQFALKLAFPGVLAGYAEEMALQNPENVPFGMDATFLNTDPQKEQHFLRTNGHPFGRYENTVPFFRGIPPFVIYLFFVQTLLATGVEDIRDIDLKRPEARITLQVLLYLYQALEQKCHSISLSEKHEPQNEKQRNAKIYRDGQAKILYEIRGELKFVIDKLLVRAQKVPPPTPLIVTIPDALALLAAEFPAYFEAFQKGKLKHRLEEANAIAWPLLLASFVILQFTATSQQDSPRATTSLLFAWLHRLFTKCPLPALEDGIEDAETYTFLDEHLHDFLPPTSRSDYSPTDILDELGLAVSPVPSRSATSPPAFIKVPTEHLGVRTLMWAMRVASEEVFPMQDERGVSLCMYMAPWTEDRSDEQWIYAE